MKVFPETFDIAKKVVQVLTKNGGRAADDGVSLPALGSMVRLANGGDHLEIGTLYGASAAMVALVKIEFGLDGDVYCIDPYDPEARKFEAAGMPGLKGKVSATPEELLANLEELGVKDRVRLIRKESHPWPEELKDNVFATAYIDGNHLGDMPWNDFENLRARVSHYIAADNYEEEYPDVVDAMWKAMNTEDWFLYYKNLSFVALRRILPSRSASMNPEFLAQG